MNASSGQPGERIGRMVRREILAATAYQTGVAPAKGLIKLDAMENPYTLPAKLRRQWLARLGEVQINRYPDPRCASLKRQLRATFDIADAHGLVLGNGSDELIQMIALLVGGPGRSIVAPVPTFSMYQLIAAATGTRFVGVPLRADFSLDGGALLDAIGRHRPACVFLACPNNPTGNCFNEEAVTETLERAPGLVVVDEAYFSFCRRSFAAYLKRFPHLMILRTLSKSGMAALRLGFVIAHPGWGEQLEKVRLPYNISALTQCSATFCLEHYHIMRRQAERIVGQRREVFAALQQLPGLRAFPSEANFILFRLDPQQWDAGQIHDRVKAQGVLIKNLHHSGTPLENCLRVTIGSEHENRRFLETLRRAMER
ncbi:MAG: histidinol-phosphate transaminase [Gammaproteobacteria bacterium]|nr:histidinol-phosphate transaminase [Gammaproteobacteria bacterium]